MAILKKWNDGWKFKELPNVKAESSEEQLKKVRELALAETKNADSFVCVDLPHDYMIYDVHHLYRDSIGIYQKTFVMDEIAETKEYLLDFDGVYMDSTIYVNGRFAKEWKYGYSAFSVNLTPFLQIGENEVVVIINFQNPNSRWYSGAGIYRDVRWVERNKNHIALDGLYITEEKQNENIWRTTVQADLVGETLQCLQIEILDVDGTVVAKGETETFLLQSGEVAEKILSYDQSEGKHLYQGTVSCEIKNPKLWDLGKGNLYSVRACPRNEEGILDECVSKIGFREFRFDRENGLFLNGNHIKINGVCEHHDFGSLGAAFNKKAMERKLLILSEMGVNSIRTSHNMPARDLMQLADKYGFMICSESFDMWERPMTPFDYGRFFKEWYPKEVASWVRRDRNHPSLLMWSIGNEIPDTVESSHGKEIAANLVKEVRIHDPKKNALTTLGSNFMKWDNAIETEKEVELAGYNYGEYLYEEHHEKFPEFIIYGSETSSILESRGIYHFPQSAHVLSDADMQCSALGNTITGWGGKCYEDVICYDRELSFSLGQYIWTGFDYIGEPTPYDCTKNCYFGQTDTAGFKKDAYFVYQSGWTDYRERPVVHIFPYWDFNDGEIIDVSVTTNAPMVELFLNGKSFGKETINQGVDHDFVKRYRIPYEAGELKAIAYDEEGTVIAEDTEKSFGDAVALRAEIDVLSSHAYGVYKNAVTPSVDKVYANGEDLQFIVISALDTNGNPVRNAKNRVSVSVEGPGRLVGLDNGDSADFDAYKGTSRRLFGGLLLAVVASTKEAGTVTVSVCGEGLLPASVSYDSLPWKESLEGVSCDTVNLDSPIYAGGVEAPELQNSKENPVRKISLTVQDAEMVPGEDGNLVFALSKEKPSVRITAKRFPEDATYSELDWKVVTDTGIELPYIKVEEEEDQTILLTALGDGEFRVRCASYNGGNAVSARSDLEFKATGLGMPYIDPYESVLCGLASDFSLRCESGIEHGVNFLGAGAEEEWNYVGFDNLSFGSFGADEVKMYIFANTGDNPVSLRLYKGRPGEEDSELLVDTMYHKPPQWMVFQEEILKLPCRLKSGDAFYIATKDSYQLRNFVFVKKEKAYECLKVAECDALYGDAYEKTEEDIKNIGNNVVVHFDEMDFGENRCTKVSITAHTNLSVNPVQIRFTKDGNQSVQMIEVKKSADYETITYTLSEPLSGKGEIDFIFLPGSALDFKDVRFEK